MKAEAVVKEAVSNGIKLACGTAGLGAGYIAANKIPVPQLSFLPPQVQAILSKVAPSVAVMLAAYLVGNKFKDERVEAAAVGAGIAGFVTLVRKVAPDIAAKLQLNGLSRLNGPYVPPGMPDGQMNGISDSQRLQLGEGPVMAGSKAMRLMQG